MKNTFCTACGLSPEMLGEMLSSIFGPHNDDKGYIIMHMSPLLSDKISHMVCRGRRDIDLYLHLVVFN
jgi:hypothetical protein